MLKRIEELKIVKVKAVDWAFNETTYDLNDKFEPIESILVGFLIYNDDEKITIAYEGFLSPHQHVDRIRRITSIPKENVRSIEYLKTKQDFTNEVAAS